MRGRRSTVSSRPDRQEPGGAGGEAWQAPYHRTSPRECEDKCSGFAGSGALQGPGRMTVVRGKIILSLNFQFPQPYSFERAALERPVGPELDWLREAA